METYAFTQYKQFKTKLRTSLSTPMNLFLRNSNNRFGKHVSQYIHCGSDKCSRVWDFMK